MHPLNEIISTLSLFISAVTTVNILIAQQFSKTKTLSWENAV